MTANGKTEQPRIALSAQDFLSRLRQAAITGLQAGAVLYAMAYLGAPLWSAAVVGFLFAAQLSLQLSRSPAAVRTQREVAGGVEAASGVGNTGFLGGVPALDMRLLLMLLTLLLALLLSSSLVHYMMYVRVPLEPVGP